MITVKVIAIEDGLGFILPREVLSRLKVEQTGLIELVTTSNGVELRAVDPGFANQWKVAEGVMQEDSALLKKFKNQ